MLSISDRGLHFTKSRRLRSTAGQRRQGDRPKAASKITEYRNATPKDRSDVLSCEHKKAP